VTYCCNVFKFKFSYVMKKRSIIEFKFVVNFEDLCSYGCEFV
jgi:hypothetical protein